MVILRAIIIIFNFNFHYQFKYSFILLNVQSLLVNNTYYDLFSNNIHTLNILYIKDPYI